MIGTGNSLDLTGLAVHNHTVSCQISTTDGLATTTQSSPSIIVSNTAPTAPTAVITTSVNPIPVAEEDDLICSVVPICTDIDQEPLSYTFTWRDENANTIRNTTTTNPSDTLPASTPTTEGDWTCTVSVTDGTATGGTDSTSIFVESGCLIGEFDCPGFSCQDILDMGGSMGDGAYWIDPDGMGPVQNYCAMDIDGYAWTLLGKFTNQDTKNWSSTKSNWIDLNSFGNTTNLSSGTDAKSALWYRMDVNEMLLFDHLHLSDYIYTTNNCIGGMDLSSFFTSALANFPYGGANYYKACSVLFSYIPNWATEPSWNQPASSSQIGLNATSRITIAKTDTSVDTSGVISFYEADDPFEADVGLGALEDGTEFNSSGRSQDIGGPTSCGYDDSACASQYPETVFLWGR